MANTLIAFDEQDSTLGAFFAECERELDTFFASQNVTISKINSNRLNSIIVTAATAAFPSFVFGAYSHGDHESLLKSARDPYVSIALNGGSFRNSFFYTFSCNTGRNLGSDLIGRNCHCFIGYKESVAVWSTYIRPFVECANYGLIRFFSGSNTETVISEMKEKYNEHIDAIYKTDYLIAAILKDNRDALIRHGNTISLQDLG